MGTRCLQTCHRCRAINIAYDAPRNDHHNLNEETVTIKNQGSAAVDMTGWVLKDESATHRYHFPTGFTLLPATSCVSTGTSSVRLP